jgi:hypothetical protein
MNSPNEIPEQTPPPSTNAPDKGSLLIGFLVGWGAMIASSVVAGAGMAAAGAMTKWNSAFGLIASIAGLLPMASLIGLIIWYAQQGKTRSALGVAAAFGSLLALCLLLVAACFGLMSGSNFGR